MYAGVIKWYSNVKGYGVIKTKPYESNAFGVHQLKGITEIFLHPSNWKDKSEVTEKNHLPVVFEVAYERRKFIAKRCRYFNNSYDGYFGDADPPFR